MSAPVVCKNCKKPLGDFHARLELQAIQQVMTQEEFGRPYRVEDKLTDAGLFCHADCVTEYLGGESKKKIKLRISAAMECVGRYGGIDGEHHVRWVLDQVVRSLLGENYERWLAEINAEKDDDGEPMGAWDPGIAP